MILATFFATLLKPIEKNDCSYLFLLFPAAADPAPATLVTQKSNHSQQQTPMAVKDGKASKLHLKTPNVTSETHRKR